MNTRAQVDHAFTYHPPKNPEIFNLLRDEAKYLALVFLENVPDCEERERALDRIQEAVMWANAGLARNQ